MDGGAARGLNCCSRLGAAAAAGAPDPRVPPPPDDPRRGADRDARSASYSFKSVTRTCDPPRVGALGFVGLWNNDSVRSLELSGQTQVSSLHGRVDINVSL